MAILGDNTTPSSGNWSDSVAGNRQWWILNGFSMPSSGGMATQMSVYFAGLSGNVTVKFVIWNGGGGVFWQSSNLTYDQNEAWKQIGISNLFLPTDTYQLGFWTTDNTNVQWQVLPSGSHGGVRRLGTGSGPQTATFTGSVDEYGGNGFGSFAAYVTYTPGGGARVMRNGSFGNEVAVRGIRGGSPSQGTVYGMRNGVFVQSS